MDDVTTRWGRSGRAAATLMVFMVGGALAACDGGGSGSPSVVGAPDATDAAADGSVTPDGTAAADADAADADAVGEDGAADTAEPASLAGSYLVIDNELADDEGLVIFGFFAPEGFVAPEGWLAPTGLDAPAEATCTLTAEMPQGLGVVGADAGRITVTGSGHECRVDGPDGDYVAVCGAGRFFAPGDAATIAGAGGADVDPFHIDLFWLPAARTPSVTGLDFSRDEAIVATWEPAPEDGLFVSLAVFVRDEAGTTTMLRCDAPDAAGTFTVPAALRAELAASPRWCASCGQAVVWRERRVATSVGARELALQLRDSSRLPVVAPVTRAR